KITDWDAYKEELKERLGLSKEVIRAMIHKAQKNPKRVVFPEGEEEKIVRAAHVIRNENIAFPVLLGNESNIKKMIKSLGYDQSEFEVKDPLKSEEAVHYAVEYFKRRQRKGVTLSRAKRSMRDPVYYGCMMLKNGNADALI